MVYNYTIPIWQKGIKWPRIVGPYATNSRECHGLLRVPVYSLKRDENYITMVVAFNHDISLKSKTTYFCKLTPSVWDNDDLWPQYHIHRSS